MIEKSRATRWRATLVAQGGKPVGVTLTPGATSALEAIQARYNVSQREAISRALEFAAAHMGQAEAGEGFCLGGDHRPDLAPVLARLAELERRMGMIEAKPPVSGQTGQTGQPEFALEPAAAESQTGLASTMPGEAADRLVEFSARRMWEFGERVARTKLYELARQEGVVIHDTLHEYSAFVSLNMDRIRERMRDFK
ncbi:hypothetical protein G3N56_18830 [Desulfovibrio sulfodismutans]|uniref:Uncharacterized protein n=1 Tax=Desulfolutivibrio sulfodismutans TaxID=63561 RepID=A0A7K3NRI0_9BACT|nr:hypothetical protein [Desulfolutivibrio sulfodismutans]NDY58796.1 hypothetical protein [Desulfolutivibrio sulfodismutans]QLA11770.1 hypothetical protein GD606_05570 [Desulfolutivibrio sulfodismutans DSM 3696]